MERDDFELVEKIANYLGDKKGEDIVVLEVKNITLICNYFILVTGSNPTHIQALADGVVEELKENEEIRPINYEGVKKGEWILLDYGSVVLHVFGSEARKFYNLERLWGEAKEVEV